MLEKFALTLTVKPSGYSIRGQLFDGFVDGRLVVSRTTQPLLDACRVLPGEGVDPATRIVMRHQGQDHDALRSAVGKAAKLSVRDDRLGKPVFDAWRPSPFEGARSPAVQPPMRETGKAAT